MKNEGPVILVVAVVVLAILLSGPSGFFKSPFAAYQGSGFIVESITTNVPVISPSTDLNSVFILASLALNGGAQSLSGFISPSDVQSNVGYSTKFPLSISVNNIKETTSYQINNEGQTIYEYQLNILKRPQTFYWSPSCPNIGNSQAQWVIQGKDAIGYLQRLYCIDKVPVGTKGSLGQRDIDFSADMTLSVNGQATTQTISRQQQSINFNDASGNMLANAQWVGSYSTGTDPYAPVNYVAIYNSKDNLGWHLNYATDYSGQNGYVTKATTLEQNLNTWKTTDVTPSNQQFSSWDDIDAYVASNILDVNKIKTTLLSNSVTLNSIQTLQNANDKTSAKVLLPQSSFDTQNILVPKVVLKVKAAWLGIVIPVGQPKITSCPDFKFSTASGQGTAIINVNNVGNADGAFAARLDSCSSFVQVGSNSPTKIGAGASGSIALGISSGSQSQAVSQTCKVVVYDYNNPSSTDSCNLNIQASASKICIPSYSHIVGGSIATCAADGLSESVVICPYGVDTSASGQYSCHTPTNPGNIGGGTSGNQTGGGTGCFSDSDCKPDHFWNTAKCERSIIDQVTGHGGTCKQGYVWDDLVNKFYWLIVVAVIAFVIVFAAKHA